MINLMTPCRNIATELRLSLATSCAILLLTALHTQSVVAQESFDGLPVLESPSGTFFEMQEGQSILELSDSDTFDLSEDLNVPENLNVLTRGPLHEAFASTHQPDPEPSAFVYKTPPELIDEVPPEYKPDGNNVQWISGYWAWDDAQSDFIWISGIWRDVPPNRRWVPGYWDSEGAGYHWISGIWSEETQLEPVYLSNPPASLEQGPSTSSPGEEYFYVPGNWMNQNGNYRWYTGHWQPMVENWIWIPARYVWTPNGCIYQSGYWDYEMDNRGTCFAPVQFTQPVYLANNYSYRPSYALNLNVDFLTHLFVRPRCGHYFYGDWYASNFNNVQYRPWVSYSSHFRNYDPLLAYYGHRRSSLDRRYNVVQYLSRQHSFYVNNRDYRPRPTYRSQSKHANKFKHLHATGAKGPKGSKGQRTPYDDFLRKSSYVRSYQDLRTHYDRHRGLSVDGRNRGNHPVKPKHHHKISDNELRDMRRKLDQLSKAQQDRRRREHSANQSSRSQVVVLKPSGNVRTPSGPSTRPRAHDPQRRSGDRDRRATTDANRHQRDILQSISREPSQQPTIANRTTDRGPRDTTGNRTKPRSNPSDRRSQSTRDARRDAAQLADQQKQAQQQRDRDEARKIAQLNQARKAQQDRARKAAQQSQRDAARNAQQKAQQDQAQQARQDQARRSQQDQARRAQLESDRRAQEQVRRFKQQQQQSNTSPNVSGKMRMQNIPSREVRAQAARQDQRDQAQKAAQQAQRDAARKAQQKLQQDQARKSQQAAADRARQDQARRNQQAAADRARQDQARRAQQAAADRARQDQARRAQQAAAQRAQQDQARRNQQAAADRARQDQARRAQQRDQQQRAQQQRAQQQAAQRAKQQRAQRDAAKRAQEKSQRDAAKRAQASRQKSTQQSKASRLRNRNQSKK